MIITKKTVAEKILEYLHHNITLAQLVDWSEISLMDGEFEDTNFDLIKDILSRLALADVRAFGLMWEDCEAFLKKLGYKVNVKAEAI
jgi:hypothetical protein